jgi:hypothetical protein
VLRDKKVVGVNFDVFVRRFDAVDRDS